MHVMTLDNVVGSKIHIEISDRTEIEVIENSREGMGELLGHKMIAVNHEMVIRVTLAQAVILFQELWEALKSPEFDDKRPLTAIESISKPAFDDFQAKIHELEVELVNTRTKGKKKVDNYKDRIRILEIAIQQQNEKIAERDARIEELEFDETLTVERAMNDDRT